MVSLDMKKTGKAVPMFIINKREGKPVKMITLSNQILLAHRDDKQELQAVNLQSGGTSSHRHLLRAIVKSLRLHTDKATPHQCQ